MRIKFLAIAIVLVAAVVFAGVANAENVNVGEQIAKLQAQVAQLLARIAELKAKQAGAGTAGWCHTFNANIGMGQKKGNPELEALRIVLQKEGVFENSASSTEGYNEALASAVVAFQEKYASEILTPSNLKHGTGFLGLATRRKLNALYGCIKKIKDKDNDTSSSSTQPAITVTSPNGGEAWKVGETHNITWTSSGLSANTNVCVRLADHNAGRLVATDIQCLPVSTGSYAWTIPATIHELAGDVSSVGNQWKIEINYGGPGTDYSYGFDESNYFTISASSTQP